MLIRRNVNFNWPFKPALYINYQMISLSFKKGYKILILHSNTDSIFGQLPTAFTLYWRFFKELWWGSKLVTINTKNIEPKWNPPTPTSSARGLDFRSMAPSIFNCNTIAWWTSVPNVLNILATLFHYIFRSARTS